MTSSSEMSLPCSSTADPSGSTPQTPDTKVPCKKRVTATDKVVNYLASKSASDAELQKKELELRREGLGLQKERLQLENEMKRAEIYERSAFIAILKDKFNTSKD